MNNEESRDINSQLRRFNAWWDSFILEAIPILAMASMVMGTVAVFNRSGLATAPVYVLAWAIIQAVSIDGLFFAVWGRVFTKRFSWENCGMILIGIICSIVAIWITSVLSFQVLWGINDSHIAMARLGISSSTFTGLRSLLAIVTFIMMVYVRSKSIDVNINTCEKAVFIAEEKAMPIAIERPEGYETIAPSDVEIDEMPPLPLKRATSHSPAFQAILNVYRQSIADGRKMKQEEIAKKAGVGYSTVKKYMPQVRQALESSQQAL